MAIAQSMLGEFDHEFAILRKTLERVPEHVPDFKPHEKSMSMARLAGHLAELPAWLGMTVNTAELNFAGMDYTPFVMTTRAALLSTFDANVGAARAALASATDEQMMGPWTLRTGDVVHFTMPRVAVIRSMVFNHAIHHRAQLGVYLRMNNVPVPSTYGPSADEGNM
ncbi:MAG: DinB family protein [Vicinamibacterales bacterium]